MNIFQGNMQNISN